MTFHTQLPCGGVNVLNNISGSVFENSGKSVDKSVKPGVSKVDSEILLATDRTLHWPICKFTIVVRL